MAPPPALQVSVHRKVSQRSTFVPFVLPFTACKQAGTWRFVSTAGRPRSSAERSISRSVFEIAHPSVLRGTMNSSATDVRVQIDERNCGSQCSYKASALSASQHQERRRSKTLTTLWLRFLHSCSLPLGGIPTLPARTMRRASTRIGLGMVVEPSTIARG